MKRFGKVVIRTYLQSFHFITQRVFGRYDNHTYRVTLLPDVTQDVETVATGQHQVEQHAIVLIQVYLHLGIVIGESLFAQIFFTTEVGYDAIRKTSFVFYDQYLHTFLLY